MGGRTREDYINNPWFRDDDDSVLEIYDLKTDTRRVLKEFDHLIEAPNWSKDGKALYFNAGGRIHRIDDGGSVHLAEGFILVLYSDYGGFLGFHEL